jgi:hypothetical protein
MVLVPQSSGRTLGLVTMLLPGADRKRTISLYQYRVTFRTNNGHEPGCVMTWEVSGGRLPYQIAAERLADGSLKYHCTCADAVYRGEGDPHHQCKHVHGLLDTMPPVINPVNKQFHMAA